jgi:Ca2+-transporting ATPase
MIPMKDVNPTLSLRIDGKESIEQQLDIHVSDMQELEGPNPPVSITMKDLIAGIRYVMTYRIKNGRMRHLDLELCKRLCRALLQRMAEVNGRFLIGKRPTDEANEAFYLFGEFLEEGK